MTYRKILALAALYVVCLSFTCEDCEIFFSEVDGPVMTVQAPTRAVYAVGEAVTLRSEFPAAQEIGGTPYEISELGGLVILQIFTLSENGDTLRPARDSFTITMARGERFADLTTNDPAIVALGFDCLAGGCGFAADLRGVSPGRYVLRVRGSEVDAVDADFEFCGQPMISATVVEGETNLEALGVANELIYVPRNFSERSFSSQGGNFFAFTVTE